MGKKIYPAKDVFTIGQPTVTLVQRDNGRKKRQIERYLESRKTILVVAGPSKCGKTVLVTEAVGTTECLIIDGARIKSLSDFWAEIDSRVLIAPNSITTTQTTETSAGQSLTGEIKSGTALGVVVSSSVEETNQNAEATAKSIAQTRRINLDQVGYEWLKTTSAVIVIDDFHYIAKSVQRELVRIFKNPLSSGKLGVIFLLTSNHINDAVQVEKDMSGRIDHIDIPNWSIEELAKIATLGFPALNIAVENEATFISTLAGECFSSPYIMQRICLMVCIELGVRKTLEKVKTFPPPDMEALMQDLANLMKPLEFIRLIKGPPERGKERIKLIHPKTGEKFDRYSAVLWAIAHLKPGLSHTSEIFLNYVDIAQWINTHLKRSDGQSKAPVLAKRQITDVLAWVSKEAHEISHSANGASDAPYNGDPVINWDSKGERVILEPFFGFFLRHGTWHR